MHRHLAAGALARSPHLLAVRDAEARDGMNRREGAECASVHLIAADVASGMHVLRKGKGDSDSRCVYAQLICCHLIPSL